MTEKNNLLLVFDTETSGLWPKNQGKNYPHIVQLSFVVFDIHENKIVFTYNEYIKQDEDMNFNAEAFKINKITKEMCDNGVSIVDALNQFYTYYMNVGDIIAHNYEFDKKMIELEILRNFEHFKTDEVADIWVLFNTTFNDLWSLKTHCTMELGKHICNIIIKGKYGTFKKQPKLIELYEKLFNEKPANLHDSYTDCLVCLKCFMKMKHDTILSNETINITPLE